MDFKSQKVLVTGGAGFIGSNLCDSLLKLNAKVICLDNLSTGYIHNISHLLKNPNFEFVNDDIRNFKNCLKITKEVNIIFHQAALGSVPRSVKDPITTNEVNISGFINILKCAVDNNIKRVIYAASSSTYGDSKFLPKIEKKIGKPLSPYAITKYVNELYAKVFKDIYGLDSIGLRYFNVYGKRQNKNGAYAAVIPKFIDSLLNNESPTINGDGSYSRDFTHIDNVIQMNILAANTNKKESLNKVYNTACGENTSVLELFKLIKKNISNAQNKILKIDPIFGNIRQGDVPHSLASIDFAKNNLGYKPKVLIDEGIKRTVKWYLKNVK
tara:strand:+ start:297 stop:1277 length:981 start_codon:yes stop_codon:yes gene_type:complete